MSKDRPRQPPGFGEDLLFSVGTYLLLSTILGIIALLFRWELEPYVGRFVATIWPLPIVLGYCIWQFCTFRRLRREEMDAAERSDLDSSA